MNTSFIINKEGEIEKNYFGNGVEYWDCLRQTVQNCLDELTGGEPFNRNATSVYLEEQWRENVNAWNATTGEEEYVSLPDNLWQEYKNNILNEIEKQSSPF